MRFLFFFGKKGIENHFAADKTENEKSDRSGVEPDELGAESAGPIANKRHNPLKKAEAKGHAPFGAAGKHRIDQRVGNTDGTGIHAKADAKENGFKNTHPGTS